MLTISVLMAYQVINNSSLTIVTDDKTFNGCRVSNVDLSLIYIRDKDGNLYRIKLDDIIGIQFIDKMAMAGMK